MKLAPAALALSLLAAPAAAAPPTAFAVPFIEDDYARALGQARGRHLPIFVEAWAPW
jgi:hypothetical protein